MYQQTSQSCQPQAAGQFYWNGMALCAPAAAKDRPHTAAPPARPAAPAAHVADGLRPDWMLAAALLLALGLRTHFYFFPRRADGGVNGKTPPMAPVEPPFLHQSGEPL
jgi:hypothetical protein